MTPDVKGGDTDASLKMQTFLRALREGITSCPVVQRSLDIITKSLGTTDPERIVATNIEVPFNEELASCNYLPAFPHINTDLGSSTVSGMDLDGFSFLDCFPENHFDSSNSSHDWFLPP